MKEYIKYQQDKDEFKSMINHIANLCAIPSVSIEGESEDYPFGKEANNALDYALNLAKEFGFNTYKDVQNRYGFAEIGSGDKIIGILAHLDVVPAGDESQWNTSAFVPVITDDAVICRGSLDDKGPSIINLYAMKYILDNNLISSEWKIRIIFGISEETTMKSMKYYLADFGAPYISYTPDGEWPLIYAEKMVYHVNLEFPKIEGVSLDAGDVVNQIPDSVILKYQNKQMTIKGIGGHGSTPEKGDNAVIKAIKMLYNIDSKLREKPLIKFVMDNLSKGNYELNNIFKNYADFSGNLSANLGMVRTYQDKYIMSFDLRVPVTHSVGEVTDTLLNYLEDHFEGDVKMHLVGSKNPKYIDIQSKLVTILMETFNEALNVKEVPLAIGGGTYARLIDSCVAFGSTKYMHLMHGPNEYFTFKEIKESLEIYINALNRLQDYDK
ncbi:M20 family metallopeptidase [Metamycoplasma neophronis]|uniref:M20 family metallopeptidase n=2 Tax=Metamycoplasma neophronis TaxID=872983 RepID=A0ABY2Z1E6_9BACT|nr:M20 family metallopeptidase [Metamycoplasma neophronis]